MSSTQNSDSSSSTAGSGNMASLSNNAQDFGSADSIDSTVIHNAYQVMELQAESIRKFIAKIEEQKKEKEKLQAEILQHKQFVRAEALKMHKVFDLERSKLETKVAALEQERSKFEKKVAALEQECAKLERSKFEEKAAALEQECAKLKAEAVASHAITEVISKMEAMQINIQKQFKTNADQNTEKFNGVSDGINEMSASIKDLRKLSTQVLANVNTSGSLIRSEIGMVRTELANTGFEINGNIEELSDKVFERDLKAAEQREDALIQGAGGQRSKALEE